jgi:(p)ppGpp synthase/HD superfamily hydrolase
MMHDKQMAYTTRFNQACIDYYLLCEQMKKLKIKIKEARAKCEFGKQVAALVADLTDVSRFEDGNRQARKCIDREHTAKASPDAKTIKLADLIDNTRSIVAHDPDFAKVYLGEKRQLLKVLREGDPVLWKLAFDLVEAA